MKSRINKFMFFNFEKEETWLNEMASRGIEFNDYSFFRYTFDDGIPGRFIYRIEFIEHSVSHPETRHYIKFLEEAGIECVSCIGHRLYMRKPASEGPFEVYTDLNARLRQYTKLRNFVMTVFILCSLSFVFNTILIFVRGPIPHLNIAAFTVIVAIAFFPTLLLYSKKVRHLRSEIQIRE